MIYDDMSRVKGQTDMFYDITVGSDASIQRASLPAFVSPLVSFLEPSQPIMSDDLRHEGRSQQRGLHLLLLVCGFFCVPQNDI